MNPASSYVQRTWLPVVAAGLLLRIGGPMRHLFVYRVEGDSGRRANAGSIYQLEDAGLIEWWVDSHAKAYRAKLTAAGEKALYQSCPEFAP